MFSTKLEHGPIQIIDRSQPQGREVQRGGPALGPPHQGLDLLVTQPETGATDQQFARLRNGEREIVHA